MRYQRPHKLILIPVLALALEAASGRYSLSADQEPGSKNQTGDQRPNPAASLSPSQWKRLDRAVDGGLKFLATRQEPDGSFKCDPMGQPAVTGFCVLAFLSRGHVPDQGPYGVQIRKAVEFVLSAQQDNGLIFSQPQGGRTWSIVGTYNHAISGVMLSEVYGMSGPGQQESIRKAIVKALEFTRSEQRQGEGAQDRGGWRYLTAVHGKGFADLSVTGWQLMFYRSAKNAEFDVPEEYMNDAVAYVERCFDETKGTFFYGFGPQNRNLFSRGMAGAGILSLSLAGKHDTKIAQRAAQYILDHPFDRFNRGGLTPEDRFYYGAYYCSHGMYQLGGKPWDQFYSVLLKTMADNQSSDGSWDLEAHPDDRTGGRVYPTSLAILSLTPPYQLLPIYQR